MIDPTGRKIWHPTPEKQNHPLPKTGISSIFANPENVYGNSSLAFIF